MQNRPPCIRLSSACLSYGTVGTIFSDRSRNGVSWASEKDWGLVFPLFKMEEITQDLSHCSHSQRYGHSVWESNTVLALWLDCVLGTSSVKQRGQQRAQPRVKLSCPGGAGLQLLLLLLYVFVSHKPLGRKINWNCVHVNMSPTEFNYSGSETVTIERGSLWAREYSLSKFIKVVACLVLSTVPLTHVIPTLRLPGLPGRHGSSMPPYCFQEALSNSYPSTGDY